MARAIGRLNAAVIKNAKLPGMYPDGAGLYLRVGPTGAASWVFRFMERGRAHEMGLGPLHIQSVWPTPASAPSNAARSDWTA